MTQLSANDAIDRFKENEERVDKFVNQYGNYNTNTGDSVETLPSFIARKDSEIDSRYPDGYINRGAFAYPVVYAANDIVTFGGLAYLNVSPYTSTATTPDADRAHWVVYQGVIEAELEAAIATEVVSRGKSSYSPDQLLRLEPRPILTPNQDFIKAILSGTVKVVIVGDSISAGADNWYSNTYAQQLTQMLKLQIPFVEWNVVNLAIGGMGAAQLQSSAFAAPGSFNFAANTGSDNINTQYWPNGSTSGKTWRDHVKDEAPDLIVYAFGMNDGTDVNAFWNNTYAFMEYAKTWTKKPWYSFVSCFLPNEHTTEVYPAQPHTAWQPYAQEIADMVRWIAIRFGYGLIDVNGMFRLLRDGVRREAAIFKQERNFRYWGDSAKWNTPLNTGNSSVSGGEMTFTGLAQTSRLIKARDVDMSFDIRRDDSTGVSKLGYRFRNDSVDLSGFSVQLETDGNLNLYYGSGVLATAAVALPSVGTFYNLRVKATADLHEVWLNGVKKITYRSVVGLFSGSVWVCQAQGTGTVKTAFLTYAPETVVTDPLIPESELYGVSYPSDFYTNPDTIGGNFINHPTIYGQASYYWPAVQNWVNDLKTIFERKYSAVSLYSPETALGFSGAGGTPAKITQVAPLTITIASEQWVEVSVSLGYLNSLASTSGILGVFINNVWRNSWFLPVTGAAVDAVNHVKTFKVLMAAGTNTIELGWTIGAVGTFANELKIGGPGGGVCFSVETSLK